ncbi:BolA family transcriptional regulator [Pelagibacteraceae bacterium]|mgnify:FL=1|nr:BolA family transcriptional regulator [Pelagibacteraceae bacterium]MDC1158837.1 BolA/IbaG family iron-sulfur metabolism protein [Pelagibacteraceae bacterium]
MKNYFDEIESRLKKQVEIEELVIVDNSHKHKGHKFFSAEKFHLHLKIKSSYLKSITPINAQKMVMKILKEDLKSRIHALEISIE